MHSCSLTRLRSAALAAIALLAAPVFAASFVVPPDRELIRRADAVVIATPLASYTQINDDGGIETVTPIRVEEVLKGADIGESPIVVEPGGEYHGRAMVIPGVPRFAESERSLLLLTRTGRARWAVTEIVLGKFTFRSEGSVLARDSNEIPNRKRIAGQAHGGFGSRMHIVGSIVGGFAIVRQFLPARVREIRYVRDVPDAAAVHPVAADAVAVVMAHGDPPLLLGAAEPVPLAADVAGAALAVGLVPPPLPRKPRPRRVRVRQGQ